MSNCLTLRIKLTYEREKERERETNFTVFPGHWRKSKALINIAKSGSFVLDILPVFLTRTFYIVLVFILCE